MNGPAPRPSDISPALAAAMAREAQQRWSFPELYLPSQVNLEAFTIVIGGLPYTFTTKAAAREMRDTLNGMTLEGEL